MRTVDVRVRAVCRLRSDEMRIDEAYCEEIEQIEEEDDEQRLVQTATRIPVLAGDERNGNDRDDDGEQQQFRHGVLLVSQPGFSSLLSWTRLI